MAGSDAVLTRVRDGDAADAVAGLDGPLVASHIEPSVVRRRGGVNRNGCGDRGRWRGCRSGESGLASPTCLTDFNPVAVGEPVAVDGQQRRLAVVAFLYSDIEFTDESTKARRRRRS